MNVHARRSATAMAATALAMLMLLFYVGGFGVRPSAADPAEPAGPPDATWVWTSSQIYKTGDKCTAEVHGQNNTDTAQSFEARASFADFSTDQSATVEVPARQLRTAALPLAMDREHMLILRAVSSRWAFTAEVICHELAEPQPTPPSDDSTATAYSYPAPGETATETGTATPGPTATETETATPDPTATETETATPDPTATETETATPDPTTPEPNEVSRTRINPGDWQLTGPIYSVAEGVQALQGSISALSGKVGNHTRNICVDGSVRNVDGDRNQLRVHLLSPTSQTVQVTFHTNHGSWSTDQEVSANRKTTLDAAALLLHPASGPYPNATDVVTSVEVTSVREVFVECAQYFRRSLGGGIGGVSGMTLTPAISN